MIQELERPRKVVCVGRNYREHCRELGNEIPEEPLIFLKPPSAVVGDGEPVVLPPESRRVEHEAEIGVVLGRPLRRAGEEEALAAVAGYTCVNDVTARDLQERERQWARSKGFDSFCPAGPAVAAASDLPPWRDLRIVCRVDGRVRQRGHAADMVFGVPALLSYISTAMTLEPGDLVATGTPAGVGPLEAGDEVEVEVTGVGTLRNPVVREDERE